MVTMTRTAADIARERGWRPGTVVDVVPSAGPWTITAIGRERLLVVGKALGEHQVGGDISHWREHDPDADLVGAMAEACGNGACARACLDVVKGRGECFADHQGDGILSALIAGLDDFFVHGEDLILRYDGSPAAFAALERFESAYDRETEQP